MSLIIFLRMIKFSSCFIVAAFLFTGTAANALTVQAKCKNSFVNLCLKGGLTEDEINKRVDQLAKVHAAVREMPVDQNLLENTILPEIRSNRKKVAPHFLERNEIPQGSTAYQELRNWISKYPEEHTAYLTYVEQTMRKYSTQYKK